MYVKLLDNFEWRNYNLKLEKGTIIKAKKMEDITRNMDIIERTKNKYITSYNNNTIILSSDEVVEVEVKEVLSNE